MARLIRSRNATDPTTGKTIQHALYDEGHAYTIYRWDEETDTNELVYEIAYEGHADRHAARAMAMGALDSLHQQTLHEIHGDSFTDKHGIKLYWAESMGRYVTIPEDDE